MRIVTVICTRMCARKKNKRKEEREMPILQYKCTKCGKRFEELVKVYRIKCRAPIAAEKQSAIIRARCIRPRENRQKNVRGIALRAGGVIDFPKNRITEKRRRCGDTFFHAKGKKSKKIKKFLKSFSKTLDFAFS